MQSTTRTLTAALPTLRTRTRTAAPAVPLLSSVLAAPLRSFSTAPAPRSAAPGSEQEAVPEKLAYFVPRTAHGELVRLSLLISSHLSPRPSCSQADRAHVCAQPVYTDYKNGGSRVLTIVRKAQGDVEVRPPPLPSSSELSS